MLKKKFAAAAIAVAATFSLAACGGEEADGTWKNEDGTIEINDGRYKVTSTAEGEEEISVEGDVDYENQEILVSQKDVMEAMKSTMSEEDAQFIDEQLGDKEDEIRRSKFTIEGDTLTMDGDEFTRED